MIRLPCHMRYAAAIAAIAGLSLFAPAADAAVSALKAEALDSLKACITKDRDAAFCVAQAVPDGRDGLKACAASFCEAAQRADPLVSEQALDLLKRAALVIKEVKNASAILKAPAGTMQGNAENGIANIRDGRKVEANDWDIASLSNPAGDVAKGVLVQHCARLESNADPSLLDTCVMEAANLLALRVSSIAYRLIVQRLHWPEVEKSAACTQMLRKRYDAYFDASRFQWPWELYINGLPSARGDTPLLCEGFRDVPTRQWIVMHPTLGVRYSGNAEQKVDAAIIIELIGLRRWQWSGAEAVSTRGASLILSYSDQSDAKDTGWGLMVHLNDDVSIGLVRHKSDTNNKVSVVLGYEFGKLVGQDKRAACAKLFDPALCSRVDK